MASLVRALAHRTLDFVDPGNNVRRAIRMRREVAAPVNSWLRQIERLVHVGANTGQEAGFYDWLGLEVLWIEPIPEAFAQLEKNIASFNKQRAVKALVTDVAGRQYPFNVTANDGQSSSMFELIGHKEIWPEIELERTIEVTSTTLDTLLPGDHPFDGLVLDTQGSELLVLQGAERALPKFKFIRTEAANFELYKGAVLEDELTSYLQQRGFTLAHKLSWGFTHSKLGWCSDLIFRRA
jgi:FkbM family methyltransferase